jgi:hypothetical protein
MWTGFTDTTVHLPNPDSQSEGFEDPAESVPGVDHDKIKE